MKATKLIFIMMPLSIFLAFMWAPPAEILGESSRIIYFHVPLAWGSVLAFVYSGIVSILFLADKKGKYTLLDERAYNSAGIGMVFTILAIISGAIWAKMSWGSYWNWDPRQTSITILMLIYIAYFSLHSALKDNESKGRICCSYLIFAMITVPLFIFIIPRMYPSLHPDPIINPERKLKLNAQMRTVLMISLFSFTLLYFYLLNLMNRISFIDNKYKEKYYEE